MSTSTPPNPRATLGQALMGLVGPGRRPAPYTRAVMTVNDTLAQNNIPLPDGFDTVVKHNVTLVERGEITSTTAHLNEVGPLLQSAVHNFREGNHQQGAICVGGALGNMGASMIAASNEASARKIGKDYL